MSEDRPEKEKEFIPRGEQRRLTRLDLPEEMERRKATLDRRQGNNRMYATFFIDNHFFGVEVENVQEVFAAQGMTSVPLAPPIIAGLINLRGEIVTTIDLRIRLGFMQRPAGAEAMSVVIRTAEGPVNFLVDQIADVIEVQPGLFEPPPETIDSQLASVLDGVYKLEERLFLALNTAAVIQGANEISLKQ